MVFRLNIGEVITLDDEYTYFNIYYEQDKCHPKTKQAVMTLKCTVTHTYKQTLKQRYLNSYLKNIHLSSLNSTKRYRSDQIAISSVLVNSLYRYTIHTKSHSKVA